MLEENIQSFKNHVLLYSKGHYVSSKNTSVDLLKIAVAVGLVAHSQKPEMIAQNELIVAEYVARLTWECILELGNDPAPPKLDRAGHPVIVNGVQIYLKQNQNDEDNSWEKVFVGMMKFMLKNREEIIRHYGVAVMHIVEPDGKGGVEVNENMYRSGLKSILNENVIRSMLVIIAQVNTSDMELPKPNSAILPLYSEPKGYRS